MEKIKNRMMVFCAVLLCAVMVGIFLRVFVVQVLVKRLHMDNALTKAVLFDAPTLQRLADIKVDGKRREHIKWEQLYPFEETNVADDIGQKEKISTIHSKAIIIKEKVHAYTSELSAGYMAFVECANRYNGLIKWNIPRIAGYNSVVEIGDGQLTAFYPRRDTSSKANAIISFSRYCGEQGIPLIYVAAPGKIGRHDSYSGTVDFSNQNTDEFLAFLEYNNIRFIDLRENIEANGFVQHNLFYKTDNHWKTETGIWVASVIAGYLNEKKIIPNDSSHLNLERWETHVYKDCFLGSRGRVVTLARTFPDDFTLLSPLFETRIHYISPEFELDTTGDFSIIYDMESLEKKDFQGKVSCHAYDVYPLGTYSMENLLIDKGRILILMDSFGMCVAPFLALNVQHMDAVNLRGFSGSIKTLIRKNKPDAVIILYCAGQLSGLTEYTEVLFSFR